MKLILNKFKKIVISKDKKRLASNFLSLSALQIFTYALPLLTMPYLVKVLGVEKYGLVMFAQSFIVFFSIVVDYGFNLSATREISIYRNDKEKVTEIFSSVITIKILLASFLLLFLVLIVFTVERFYVDKELYFFTYLFVIGQSVFPIWYFQGLESMKYITIINILSRVLFTVAIFLFVRNETDYILVPLLNGFGVILGGIYALYLIKKTFKQEFTIQKFEVLKRFFKDSTSFFLSRVSVSLYTTANAFVLGLFTNNTIVGYYAIAEKLYQAVQSLYGPIVQALYPYVAKERNVVLFKKIFYSATVLNIICIIALLFFSEFIFAILFSQSIGIESKSVFHILLMASLFTVPSVLLGYPFLAALGFAAHANNSVILGSVIHLIGLALLGFFDIIGIYNVAFMVIFTEIFVFLFRVYGVKKNKLW